MDTHMNIKYYNSAFLGSYCSFVMKDLVEWFIVLQIQTAPSRLQPASAECFLATMILPSAPSGIRAHAQHATLSRPAGFGISKHRSSVETATQNMRL